MEILHLRLDNSACNEPRGKFLLLSWKLVPNFENLALREKILFIMLTENFDLMKEIATLPLSRKVHSYYVNTP